MPREFGLPQTTVRSVLTGSQCPARCEQECYRQRNCRSCLRRSGPEMYGAVDIGPGRRGQVLVA